MRPRIRTVKPEFFANEKLFDLEQQSGFPIRLAFEGLWCWADREGRFEWRPRTLKAGILPFDDVDFSRVLDALESRGFIVKYASGVGREREEYGWIPTLKEHQAFNNKEKPSELPAPEDSEILTEGYTRDERVDDALPESLGKDRVERERNGNGTEPPTSDGQEVSVVVPCPPKPDPERRQTQRPVDEPFERRFNSNRLEELFSELRKAAKGGSFRLQRSDYDRAQKAVQWAHDDHPDDPAGATRHSIEQYLKHAPGFEAQKGYPFWGWASDPGAWYAHKPGNGRRNGPGEVSTEFNEDDNPDWAQG